MEHTTEAQAVAELALKGAGVQQIEVGGVPFVAYPNGVELVKYDELLENPLRIEENQRFRDAESFGAYVNRFKQPSTLIVGNRDKGYFQATLDYHISEGQPKWGGHVAGLDLRFSEEWKAWTSLPAQIGQVQFAEHIEDWMHTIGHPDGATLQGLVLKFQALKETTFKSSMNLANGDVNLTYIEDSERGTETGAKFPTEMTLMMPVYEGQLPIQVKAKIRYRIQGGNLSFQIALMQRSEVLRKAFADVCEAVENITSIKPLMGA